MKTFIKEKEISIENLNSKLNENKLINEKLRDEKTNLEENLILKIKELEELKIYSKDTENKIQISNNKENLRLNKIIENMHIEIENLKSQIKNKLEQNEKLEERLIEYDNNLQSKNNEIKTLNILAETQNNEKKVYILLYKEKKFKFFKNEINYYIYFRK